MNGLKEVGGYFGLESFSGEEYYKNLIAVNSGRNALAYLIKARKIKKLYIPAFLCDTVYKVCEREGCEYEFYSIDHDFRPVFNKSLGADQWLYIVNFYGQISNKQIKQYKKKYTNIIFDNVQAFFQKPVKNIDTVYSCRKFFGVPDGGYISTNALPLKDLEADLSAHRMKHILGRFEKSGSEFYSHFQKNDEAFYDMPLRKMSLLTKNLLRSVNYSAAKKARKENFLFLASALRDKNPLKLRLPKGPYAYPFYIKNGMKLKSNLAAEKIYVPTLWPDVPEWDALATDFSQNILPLPCDHRYSREDMRRIITIIENFNND